MEIYDRVSQPLLLYFRSYINNAFVEVGHILNLEGLFAVELFQIESEQVVKGDMNDRLASSQGSKARWQEKGGWSSTKHSMTV